MVTQTWQTYVRSNKAESILQNDRFNEYEVASLIQAYLENKSYTLQLIIKKVLTLRSSIQSHLYLIVPHYQSSICLDDCKYCGFKKSNKQILRKSLTNLEFVEEFNLLLDWGYQVIELVYATDPDQDAHSISKRIELAKSIAQRRGVPVRIGLNANAFSTSEYKELKDSGLDFFVLWMETYDRNSYTKWHSKNTPKFDFVNRYDSYTRAISVGLTNFGMGVLLGLADWKEDVFSLLAHAIKLNKEMGYSPYILGVPRVKKAQNQKFDSIEFLVNDQDFIFIANLYRLVFPNTKLFLNTREDLNLNLDLLDVGADLFTIDCGTFPGAYLNPNYITKGYEQFSTKYYMRDDVKDLLIEKGFELKTFW